MDCLVALFQKQERVLLPYKQKEALGEGLKKLKSFVLLVAEVRDEVDNIINSILCHIAFWKLGWKSHFYFA